MLLQLVGKRYPLKAVRTLKKKKKKIPFKSCLHIKEEEDELDLVTSVLLQLVGKRYPLKAVRTMKKKKKKKKKKIPFKSCLHIKEEEDCSLHREREPVWEHKALSWSDSVFHARCSKSSRKPPKTGAYHHRSD